MVRRGGKTVKKRGKPLYLPQTNNISDGTIVIRSKFPDRAKMALPTLSSYRGSVDIVHQTGHHNTHLPETRHPPAMHSGLFFLLPFPFHRWHREYQVFPGIR